MLADDEVLLPGLVDTHVHVNEPGRTDWEGFASATRAAAAGGVTTIVDMPLNSIPPTTTVAALEAKRAVAARPGLGRRRLLGRRGPGQRRRPRAASTRPGVFGFKCFLLDSGVEEFPHLAPAELADAMAETARLGSLMVVHAEDADAITECAHGAAYRGFLDSRPDAAEERAIALVIDTARAHRWPRPRRAPQRLGCRAGAAGRPGRRRRRVAWRPARTTCTSRPASIADGATELKCCPPIRDAANRDALWAGARSTGDIDLVVTRPLAVHRRPQAPGHGRLRRRLGRDRLAPARACRSCGRAPASAACPSPRWCAGWPPPRPAGSGWPARARSPSAPTPTSASSRPTRSGSSTRRALHHKNPVSPYAGRTLTGTVRATWLRGRTDRPVGPHRAADC